MFCINCGNQIDKGAAFCGNCGHAALQSKVESAATSDMNAQKTLDTLTLSTAIPKAKIIMGLGVLAALLIGWAIFNNTNSSLVGTWELIAVEDISEAEFNRYFTGRLLIFYSDYSGEQPGRDTFTWYTDGDMLILNQRQAGRIGYTYNISGSRLTIEQRGTGGWISVRAIGTWQRID